MRKRSTWAAVATLALAWVASAPVSPASEIKDGEGLLRAMQERYAKDWYETLSFQQDAITHNDDGTNKTEIWYEAALLPGKLRIDIGAADSPNGMLVADGKLNIFKNGEVTTSQPFVHMLLVLGFDVYKQSAETTIAQVKGQGFDLSKMHEETWEGEAVYVVGADKGDLKTRQFWIEKKRLLFVRLIQPDRQDATKTSDTRFMDYKKLNVGWVAARVEFYVNGKNEFSEVYSNIKANPKLDAGRFDAGKMKQNAHP
jgi:outer membrane lipoprotein-sorting protein